MGASKKKPPAKLPPGAHETPALPDPEPCGFDPFPVNTPGVWLTLSDVHLPYHDRTALELAVGEARRRGAVGVMLNGDILDSHEVSRHDKDPTAPRYVKEIEVGRQFLAWLRDRLPKARFVYKAGNHEDRLGVYIVQRAPALFGLEGIDLPSLLHLKEHGVEFVTDKRVVLLGKLNVIHGHEYPGGVSSPVNPARGLYLKARSIAICGHHHQTSEHHARDIRGRSEAAWSLGCLCHLHPKFAPLNNWNLGFAVVSVEKDGTFTVENKRVLGGKVV